MHSEFFDCSICLSTYNTTDRVPKILPDCGHTICSSCLKQILKLQHVCCPLDRKPLDKNLTNTDLVPTNMLILQMLDGKAQEKTCKVHKEPVKFYCVVDKCEVCERCVSQGGTHQGHFVENMSEIFSKAAAKKNRLKGMLNDFEGEVNTLHELLEENKKNTVAVMKEKFTKLYDVIYKKEQEISAQIDSFFNREKSCVENKIHTDISIRELIRSKIANLGQLEINDRLIKELEDDLSLLDFNASDQYSEVYSRSKEIQLNIEAAFHDLMCLTGFAIEEFEPLHDDYLLERQAIQQESVGVFSGKCPLRIEIEYDWLVVYPVCPEDDLNEVERGNILSISKSKELSKVCLDFRKRKLCKEMAGNLANLWKELKDFTCVKLFLTNTEFNDQDLIDLCAYDFWCDKRVQDLWIYLITTKIGEEGVKKLGQVIDGQNVKSFILDASSSTFTDDCLKKLAKELICKLQRVESFDLRVTSTNVGDLGMEVLYKELMKVGTHLQTLNLWLDITQVKERGFECLVKNLFPLMKNLANLDLRFPRYENPTGNYLKLILEGIGVNLLKLKQLGLNCYKPGMSEQMKKYVEQWKRNHTRINISF